MKNNILHSAEPVGDDKFDGCTSKAIADVFLRHVLPKDLGCSATALHLAYLYIVAIVQISKFLSPQRSVTDLSLSDSASRKISQVYFPQLARAYYNVRPLISDVYKEMVSEIIALDNTGVLNSPYLLSDLYLDLKEAEPSILKFKGDQLSKISGAEFFKRTQFFTEPYMADFLSTSALVALQRERGDSSIPVYLDPACGAGNLLISAFNALLTYYDSSAASKKPNANTVFQSLVGYDLDYNVAAIASASLTIAFARATSKLPVKPARILACEDSSGIGFFSHRVGQKIDKACRKGDRIMITNPPFLGRRLMDPELRNFLNSNYPEARGDLCSAFILRCSEFLEGNGVLALVHQNTFWHLDSLEQARSLLRKQMTLYLSANLGSGAFRHLTGEKAAVSLSILNPCLWTKNKSHGHHDISHYRLPKRVEMLSQLVTAQTSSTPSRHEQSHNFAQSLWRTTKRTNKKTPNMAPYCEWAIPMQGTSTGNSAQAVRYSWEVPSVETNWVSVSKGGGYCRWWGLNRYVVLWGHAGEQLRQYSGHALRNVNVIDETDLVFSDTGTRGLNVRVRAPGQVFIASGPGIRIQAGNEMAHLAYLNSRVASLVLRSINPKLTIAAGYIKKLPFNKTLATHTANAQLARKCVAAKKAIAARKLTNDECDLEKLFPKRIYCFDDYFKTEVTNDFKLELKKLEAESKIDENVLGALELSRKLRSVLNEHISEPIARRSISTLLITPRVLDQALAENLAISCHYRGRSKEGRTYGIDGVLEALAQRFDSHPKNIITYALSHLQSLSLTRKLYLDDLIHKFVLMSMGFKSNRNWHESKHSLHKIKDAVLDLFPDLERELTRTTSMTSFDQWVKYALPSIHSETFLSRPFLLVERNSIRLVRNWVKPA